MLRNDRTTRVLLSIVALLLGGNLLFQLSAANTRRALADGIPDSGAQMQAMIDQLKDVNKKLDKVDTFLESGALTVKVKDPKEDKN